jgi:hypothetical protein
MDGTALVSVACVAAAFASRRARLFGEPATVDSVDPMGAAPNAQLSAPHDLCDFGAIFGRGCAVWSIFGNMRN